MRVGCRSVALATALAAVVAFGATAHAATANKCAAAKEGLVGKAGGALLGCFSKGAAKVSNLAVAPCVSKAKAKFIAGSQGIDLKNPTSCPNGTGDDDVNLKDVNGVARAIANDLDNGFPAWTLPSGSVPGKGSKCTAGKIKCVGKLLAGLAKCYSKALGAGLAVDSACTNPVEAKFSTPLTGCMEKLEGKEDMTKPTSVCTHQPNGDAAALKATVEHWLLHSQAVYGGNVASTTPQTCASVIDFKGTSTDGVLDTGWTGRGHDASVISDGHVSVTVESCSGTAPNCGVCTYKGPHENVKGEFQANRCAGDSRSTCDFDEDCPVGTGPCRYFFGTYLPLAAGGVSTCIQNMFKSALSGTADYGTGASVGAAQNESIVFNGITISNPCPRCVGDTTANDGVKGGTCSSGPDAGATCDANGSSPNASFGTTSLDCRPDSGAKIGDLAINLNNTTGTKSATLSASSPNCTAAGSTSLKCQCATCADVAAEACASNADCPPSIVCGGKRCVGSANAGTPCSALSACPGGLCTTDPANAQATQPNACSGGSGDCLAGDSGRCVGGANDTFSCITNVDCPGGTCNHANDPFTGANEHICASGPFDLYCAPVETFRQCSTNADCNKSCGTGGACGDTCSISRARECFDNGIIGDVVNATGFADPPVNHQSNPRLAALFCVGHTTAAAVNTAAGLPGLGKLELLGHTLDNGTM